MRLSEPWSIWAAFLSEKRHDVDENFQAYLEDNDYWKADAPYGSKN